MLAHAVGCTDSQEPQADAQDPTQEQFSRATLPEASNQDDCPERAAPTLCEWANSVDVIVVGSVVSTAALVSPVWVLDDPPHLAETCGDGYFVNAGLEMEVDVTSVLSGELEERTLKIRVGKAAVADWTTRPAFENGQLVWLGSSDIFEDGTTVGLALTQIPGTDLWSPMGDMPFTFAADGSAVYARDDCSWPAPEGRPNDFFELESDLASCTAVVNATRDNRVTHFTQRPDY